MSANILLASASWNSGSARTTIGFTATLTEEDVIIRAEGVTGPSDRGVVRGDCEVEVEYLLPPISTLDAAPASLVITCTTTAAATQTYTFATMKPRGVAISFQRDNAPLTFRQKYVFVGASAEACLTIS